MNITLFTSNQPRHIALAEALSKIAKKLYVVQEVNTVFPGLVEDFYKKSAVMRSYFRRVIEAEKEVFGDIKFTSDNITQLALKSGDLNMLDARVLGPALRSDVFVVFGSSYIRAPLVDILIKKGAVNIHMGVSPFYRGSSCNFWALYDGNPDLVGATVHKLSKGLDSGDILYHAFPPVKKVDGFLLGMLAVKSAHRSLAERIKNKKLKGMAITKQDKSFQIRYTRNGDFTDAVAGKYLAGLPTRSYIQKKCARRDTRRFVDPYILEG